MYAARVNTSWILILAVYAISGMAALAYEILWVRMLSLQFGISTFGVVATTTAFMSGLGLGSLLGLRWQSRRWPPLLVFALLELFIALFALAMPGLFSWADTQLTRWVAPSGLFGWYAAQGLIALMLLLIPSMLMGAGFPIMLRAATDNTSRLGSLYGINTLGACCGALLPLMLLPMLGWIKAMYVIVGLSTLAGVLALWAVWPQLRGKLGELPLPLFNNNKTVSRTLYLAYSGVGLAALMLEIGWARLFGMFMLRTEYVMALVLAIYLAGIGLGSLLANYLKPSTWMPVLPLLASVYVVMGLWLLPQVSAWLEVLQFDSLPAAMLGQGGILALFTLPVTLVLGIWLPLLSAQAGGTYQGVQLYAVNSLGAALGAVLSGLVLIPWLGTMSTLAVSAVVLLVCGLAWSAPKRISWALPCLVLLVWPVTSMPKVHELLPQSHANSRDIFYYEDVLSITHVIEQENGQRLLLSDLQRMDASSDPIAVAGQMNQARLPLLLHANPESVLFLGLGTGITAAGSLPFPHLHRTAVELSAGTIEASRQFTPVNKGVLGDTRIIRDDARRYLRVSLEQYDVIIGDLFHPDLVGRSALLSVQQFKRARARLSKDGVFVQWLALNQFDLESFEIILRSFAQVFAQGALFVDGFRIALVGTAGGGVTAATMLENLARVNESGQAAFTGGEGGWSWLGRYWGGIHTGMGGIEDEWAPRIEYQLPRARYSGQIELTVLLGALLEQRPPVATAALQLQIPDENYLEFERAYIATDLVMRSWLASLQGRDMEAQRLVRLAYEANPDDRWIAVALADRMLAALDQARQQGLNEVDALQRILMIRSDHPEVLRRLWRLAEQNGDKSMAEIYRQRLIQKSPLDRAIRQD